MHLIYVYIYTDIYQGLKLFANSCIYNEGLYTGSVGYYQLGRGGGGGGGGGGVTMYGEGAWGYYT